MQLAAERPLNHWENGGYAGNLNLNLDAGKYFVDLWVNEFDLSFVLVYGIIGWKVGIVIVEVLVI